MSKHVLVVFDIDGPLNPFMSFTANENPDFVYVSAGWHSGLFNIVEHKQWFQELVSSDATIMWGSNWSYETKNISDLFEVPEMPWVAFTEAREHQGTWKLPFMEEFVNTHYSDSAIIWVDDELHEDALQWGKNRGNVLLVKTDPAVGWTEHEKNVMFSFIDRFK